jgi:F0F1-type ATP synthase membrane subunit b/b'
VLIEVSILIMAIFVVILAVGATFVARRNLSIRERAERPQKLLDEIDRLEKELDQEGREHREAV